MNNSTGAGAQYRAGAISFPAMLDLRAATLNARERTGQLIAVAVERGQFQVTRIIGDGAAGEIPLSDFGTLPATIEFLNSLGG